MSADFLCGLGIALTVAGILVMLVVILMLFIANISDENKVKGGGAIIIGPFPIVFGTDRESLKSVLLLSITLTLLLVVITVLFYLLR